MRAPTFWWRREDGMLARLLAPAGWLYGSVTAARMGRPGSNITPKVICVGNFTVGGAGKTPVAIAVAGMVASQAQSVFFLSRGYGGRLAGPLLVDPARHSAADVGDEPLLLARHAPVVVGRDRAAAGALCQTLGADMVIMDDGLQNPSLQKDIRIAVVDGSVGVGNGRCVPAGPLRAPLARQWPFVDALVVMGSSSRTVDDMRREAAHRSIPVFDARLVTRTRPDFLAKPLLAFAGIGRPDKFFHHLEALGGNLAGAVAFGDHHTLSDGEAADLLTRAASAGAQLVTTEKDFIRMASPAGSSPDIVKLISATAVLPVEAEFDDMERFRLFLGRAAG
ncbi:MAG: tetraacyldisaccharide 4'-kinase [Beijerinckiaceae bacterium]|nr:tetraacyldisaccharide 4'-kinase [Beijerinckiaceae bacterium]